MRTDVALVSCIMPTANRRRFVPSAIRYFLAQDYPNRELVILDDGADSVADLIPDHPQIRYFRLTGKRTLGRKRNECVEASRGDLILHWDDDDWHAPHRIRYQVESMQSGCEVCGTSTLLFYDIRDGRAWKYVYPDSGRFWLSGSTLAYSRRYWSAHPFPDVNVGEDARFVWSGIPTQMKRLEHGDIHVGIIHDHNISPKRTRGAYWQPYPVEQIKKVLDKDWQTYHNGFSHERTEIEPISPIRNVFACLVHEKPECVVDLVRNLTYLDPDSTVLLYNGGNDPHLLNRIFPQGQSNIVVHPQPRPMVWGKLHDFALDCMNFSLQNIPFDTLTIVDSDQLGAREGYSRYIAGALAGQDGVGMFGNSPQRQPPTTRIAPAMVAFKEIDLWKPFLRRFPDGESKFVHWTFWPSTVFTVDAAHSLVDLFTQDEQLQEIMAASRIWATEEVILPTLVALLGYKIALNPCSYDYVKYRQIYTRQQIDLALKNPRVFWVHPVTRKIENELRGRIRKSFHHYQKSNGRHDHNGEAKQNMTLLLTLPILKLMKSIEGWLEEDEADLLIAVAAKALTEFSQSAAIVEIGSYCGRSTSVLASVVAAVQPKAKVYAIDPHDGMVGAVDQGITKAQPTLERFKHNMSRAGLENLIELIPKFSFEVTWEQPVSLLLVDGLHDYANVARDFCHFEPHLRPGAYVAFHDYASYYPGVQQFVDELLQRGDYERVSCVHSLMVVRKKSNAKRRVKHPAPD